MQAQGTPLARAGTLTNSREKVDCGKKFGSVS